MLQNLIASAETLVELGDNSEAIEELRIWLINERHAPELLPGGMRLESMIQRVKKIIELEENSLPDLDSYSDEYSFKNIELNRIKFLVTTLMRTRIFKLESLCEYVRRKEIENINNSGLSLLDSSEEEINGALKIATPSEWRFLQKFCKLRSTFFENSFINQLTNPDIASKGQGKDNIVPYLEPDWYRFVFSQVMEDLGTYSLTPFDATDDEDDLELEDVKKGTIVLVQYRLVRTLLFEGKVKLM